MAFNKEGQPNGIFERTTEVKSDLTSWELRATAPLHFSGIIGNPGL
jgi:hypothetical protein